jgi:hypothetical protein
MLCRLSNRCTGGQEGYPPLLVQGFERAIVEDDGMTVGNKDEVAMPRRETDVGYEQEFGHTR